MGKEDQMEQADAATRLTSRNVFSREWGKSKRSIDPYLLGEMTIRTYIIL